MPLIEKARKRITARLPAVGEAKEGGDTMADFNFSVFFGAAPAEGGDTRLGDALDRALAAAPDGARWTARRTAAWFHLSHEQGICPAQGWKLHVSATPASAVEVLARSAAVLLAGRSAFKFAATHDQVAALNARNTSRGHSGKFITVYPESDGEAVRIARELHAATAGLAGPRILSDRPYAPGGLVHYRYGAFVEERRITNDGFYAWMILDPDGNPVEDKRVGRYTPPSWVECPFPPHPDGGNSRTNANGGGNGRDGIVIGGRFAVREAIRHTNKGGVYRAVDTRTGDPVVLKEARPHVAADESGRDVRDRLRAEARALEAVEHLGLAPRPVGLFTQSGHLFLAQELVPGATLRQWIADMIADRGWGGHLPAALEMAGRLADVLIRAHGAGLLVRDFTPNNVMVRPDGVPVLIDLELAATAGDPEPAPLRSGTPGYAAPEQLAGAAPDPAADGFGLGATLCHLITGAPPYLLDEDPPSRPARDRLAEWLAARTAGLDLPAALLPMLLGLLDEDPARRWTPERARDALARPEQAAARPRPTGPPRPARPVEECREAVRGITAHLLATMDAEAAETLWPASCVHGAPDPCSVQHGAAGTLAALVRCHEAAADPRLPDAIGRAGRWILTRLENGAPRPAGLYFGAAGAAWALLDAGLALDDAELVDGALAVADRLPSAVESPDITHGTSGVGLAFLHLRARTGREGYAARAVEAAEALAASVEERSGRLAWSTPAQYESKLAGKRYLGFAHGVAGVGYFLAACGRAAGRGDLLRLAAAVGENLLDDAVPTERAVTWGTAPDDPPTAPYWCHGAAGIGGFLALLGEATGDERFARAARGAARTVADDRWRAPLGQCHGLAGNGDFLLDMAALTGDDRYRDDAWAFARVLLANRARRGEAVVFPDEFGQVSPSWGDGVSGVLAFLLRLQHGTARSWTAPAASASTAAGASVGSGRAS